MKFFDYIFAARPMLLLPVWSIYLVCLSYHHELSGERFLWSDLLILGCLTMVTAAAYYLNQVYDYDSDARNRKLGFLQRGIMSEKAMTASFVILSVTALGISAPFSPATFAVVVILFVMSYFYSAPPVRLKDRPVGGLIANALGYGFMVPLAVMPDITFHNAGLLGWDNPFYFSLTVGSIYTLTTLPDRGGDARCGKKTLAVVLPRTVVIMLALTLMLASVWVASYSDHFALAYLSAISSVPIAIILFVKEPRPALLAGKLPILLLTLLAGYYFPGYLLFIVAIIISTRIYYHKRFAVTYPKLV